MRAAAIHFDMIATLIPCLSAFVKHTLFAIFLCTILILSGCSPAAVPARTGTDSRSVGFAPLDADARQRQKNWHYCTPPLRPAAAFWTEKKHQQWRCFLMNGRGAGIWTRDLELAMRGGDFLPFLLFFAVESHHTQPGFI